MKPWMKATLLLTAVGASAYQTYKGRRRLYGPALGIGPARYPIEVEQGLRVPIGDGEFLVCDHYAPLTLQKLPTILIRSPYGRNAGGSIFGAMLSFFAQRFAERGYHVIIQDVRGRFDSDGEFIPAVHEREDGLATLRWLDQQTWHNGRVGLWGPSYLGIVQWLLASDNPQVGAMVPILTASQLHRILYPDQAFDLGLVLRWMAVFKGLDDYAGSLVRTAEMAFNIERRVSQAMQHLPLSDIDETLLGEPVAFYRQWMENAAPDTPLWQQINGTMKVERTTAPAYLVAGWYDFFLRAQLADYHALQAAGRNPYLTIGPWHHFSSGNGMFEGIRGGLAWFDAHLKDQPERLRKNPVRLFIMGANQWREYPAWPPPSRIQTLYLGPGRSLRDEPAPHPITSHYTYDPQAPTPALGGTLFALQGGPRDNRPLEARPDVLTFSSEPLAQDLEVIGYVRLKLYVQSDCDTTDFFGRVCDVYPDGRSINICDGLYRVRAEEEASEPDGTRLVEVDLWATAHRFKVGHCIRLIVASGAHPRWTRNPGTPGALFEDCELRPAHQIIHHDQTHPSALLLPVVS